MRIYKSLPTNRFKVYLLRFTYPKWYRAAYPTIPKTLNLSLKTRNIKIARMRHAILHTVLELVLLQIKRNAASIVMTERTVPQILNAFRNYLVDAEPAEQESYYYGKPQFRDLMQMLEEQLHFLREYELLSEINDDLSNIDSLLERAKQRSAYRKEQNEIKADTEYKKKVTVGVSEPSVASAVPLVPVPATESVLLSELRDAFIESEYGSTSNSHIHNKRKYSAHINFLIECIGDLPIHIINKSHVRTFEKKLKQRTRKLNGKQVLITANTQNTFIASCRRVFDYAIDRYDSVSKNLFAAKSLKVKTQKGAKKNRIPYSENELTALFSHPLFTSARKIKHPYQYWLPLLALYTGCRLNELCQLHTSDVRAKNNIHYISINTDTNDKSIKTSTPREIPIHPKLIELQFLKFVGHMKEPRYRFFNNGYERLFKGTKFYAGSYHRYPSRWFNGYTSSKSGEPKGFKFEVGVTYNKSTELKDLHSFRHNFKTALQRANVSKEINDELAGHKSLSASEVYMHGHGLKLLNESIQQLDFSTSVNQIKPYFELYPVNSLIDKKSQKKARNNKKQPN